jgi:hypothetical protein
MAARGARAAADDAGDRLLNLEKCRLRLIWGFSDYIMLYLRVPRTVPRLPFKAP